MRMNGTNPKMSRQATARIHAATIISEQFLRGSPGEAYQPAQVAATFSGTRSSTQVICFSLPCPVPLLYEGMCFLCQGIVIQAVQGGAMVRGGNPALLLLENATAVQMVLFATDAHHVLGIALDNVPTHLTELAPGNQRRKTKKCRT